MTKALSRPERTARQKRWLRELRKLSDQLEDDNYHTNCQFVNQIVHMIEDGQLSDSEDTAAVVKMLKTKVWNW